MLDIATLKDLNSLLRWNRLYANGKNVCLDHLYATAAQSRFAVENLLGIYLANPEHTWMAVWMAVANRAALNKRQLEYYAPDAANGDYLGHLGIHLSDGGGADDALVNEAYVHLFRLDDLPELRLDNWPSKQHQLAVLEAAGFTLRDVELRGRMRRAMVPNASETPLLVRVDAWQVAVVHVPSLVPNVTVHLLPSVVRELRERITLIPQPPSEDYIRPSLIVAPPTESREE
jgi:hypothetical protein